ncbi:protein-glutamine glutaminase family protein [Peredibacter sp. HCB2-198]|uniref:protein-glutamine glutaminase family protein n=1 Tax=Peredibacter sp. HCB2-198 TaxID=3383025 RepID=UPI0038B45F39
MSTKILVALAFSVLFMNAKARAEVVITTVFNVHESIRTETISVLSGVDGRVYKIKNTPENMARIYPLMGKVVKIDYSTAGTKAMINSIRAVLPGEVDTSTLDLNHFRYNELRQFAPTDLQTIEEATNVFRSMINDGDKRRSQCFKRAHMWAFDMWSKMNIKSEKLFIFFTQRFQMIDEYDWWFHVAPLVNIAGEDYVMDGTFFQKPTPIQEWKSFFMMSKERNCPIVEKYQDYEQNQWKKLCYLMKVPMYMFRPVDIQARDVKGVERNHWILEEIQDARRAFKGWEDTYEGYDNGKKTTTY